MKHVKQSPRAPLAVASRLLVPVACLSTVLMACSSFGGGPGDGGGTGNGSTGSGASSGVPGSGATNAGVGGAASGSGSTAGSGATAGAGTGGVAAIPRDPDALRVACEERSGTLSLGLTKLRRLTRRQLNNTLKDLVGATGDPASTLAADERIGPFENNAITPITDLLVQQHQEIAQAVAAQIAPQQATIVGCDLAAGGTCASDFIAAFGSKAFRRPLTADEQAAFLALYQLGESGVDAANGFRLVMEAFLQSPSFVYLVDVPTTGLASSAAVGVDPYTLASRLSYFLWNSMPDATLLAKAADGTLTDVAVMDAEVTRLLADDRAGEMIGLFHQQWTSVIDLPSKTKDANLYPTFGPDTITAMMTETSRFSDYVVRQGDGLLSTLLTADYGFPEGPLFDIYGVAQPSGFTPGTQVTLGTGRSGIFTQAAFLANRAHMNQTSPVHRGISMRENVLCQTIEPPPPGVSTSVPEPTEATTTRERMAAHLSNTTCATCHRMMDPLGMAFENFDPVGAYRTQDGLGVVDASGTFIETRDDLQGDYVDAKAMMAMLAQAAEVRDCVSDQWFRFALGRLESLDDACSLVTLHDAFTASGGNIRTLLASIAKSDAFQNVRSTAQGTP